MDDEANERSGGGGALGALTRRRLAIAGTAIVFLALLLGIDGIDARAVATEVSSADPRLLAAAVGVYAVSWPLRGRRYGDVLSAMGRPTGTAFLTMAVFVSQTANLVVPARAGDAVRAYAINDRRDVPYPTGFASLAVERAFDLAAIAVLGGAAIGWLALTGRAGPLEVAGDADGARTALYAATGVSATTLTVGVATVAIARSDRGFGPTVRDRLAVHPRLRGPVDALLAFVGDVGVVARNPRTIAVVGAGSLAIWALDVLTAILVLAAFDSGLTGGALLAIGTLAVSVGNLAKVLPLSQGGVGLYEAAFTGLVVALTPIGASVALAAAIVDHALKNGVTLVGGAGSVAALGISPKATAADGRTAERLERPADR